MKRRKEDGKAGGRHLPSAVVLAAGASSRFSGTKQLAEIRGKTLLEGVLDAIPASKVGETVVVIGHEAQKVAMATRGRKGVRTVINEDYEKGMASSIRAGILALRKDSEGAMLLLADQPLVTRALLLRMLRAFGAGRPKSRIVAASYGGVVSPPVIFPRRYFRELMRLRGDQGAKSVIRRHESSLLQVEVSSKSVLADVDTRDDLEAMQRSVKS